MKLEAFFRNSKTAKTAVEKMQQIGITKTYMERVDQQGQANWSKPENTLTATGLSGIVFLSVRSSVDENFGPVVIANPIASGMGIQQESNGSHFRVMAEVDKDKSEMARKILTEAGGSLESLWPKA